MKTTHIILYDVTFHIPGDQRSKDAPGHGYSARTETCTKLEEFDNIEDLSNRMIAMRENKTKFRVFKAEELAVDFITITSLKAKE